LVLLLLGGCTGRPAQVVEAFPPGGLASPWVLQGQVWRGTFEEAVPGLGDDADAWGRFGPMRVWLAIYCHESQVERCLKVRCFAFATPEDARQAFEALRPAGAKPFRMGDAGCWTEIGVLFRWGRLVFDIFGDRPAWSSELQSGFLAALISKRMPPGAIEDPQ
jgi:hypothetical protein